MRLAAKPNTATKPKPCVDLETGTIYLDPGTLDPRLAFWHEVGHVFDRAVLTEGDRDWFAYLIDRPVTPWLSDSTHETAGEIFAEAYSVAAHLGPHIRAAQLVVPPDERIGRRKNFQIWTLIERSYLRALGQ